LRFLAENGKAIEINTSGLYHGIDSTQPPLNILKRFKVLGGEFVTTGSDAHRASDIGKGLLKAVSMLKEAGFEYLTYFENRKPHLVRI